MTNTATPATSNKRQEFAAALAERILRALPEDTTDADIGLLTEKAEEIVAPAAKLALGIIRPPPKPAEHADICIERVIGGRKFHFRGFIRPTDTDGYVLGDTMMDRVRATGDTPTDGSDHLEEHRSEWVNDPELADYYVVTNERHPEVSRLVRCFFRGDRERFWFNLDGRFSRDDLVACLAP